MMQYAIANYLASSPNRLFVFILAMIVAGAVGGGMGI
jgi:hypothetical protein